MGRKRTATGRTQGTTRAIAFGVVSCLVSACASDPPDSGVYVLVDADGPVVSVACRMEMIVYGGRGTLGTEPRETRGADGLVARSWPISVGLVPDGGDASRLWGLELRVFGPGNGTCDELVLSRSVRGNFVRGQVVLLRVLLESSCLGIDCTTGGPFAATCLGGACLPVPDVRAETLPPWTPEDGVPSSFDAGGGERDAGDASSMDATRDQGGTADAEGEDAAERDATSMDARADGATDASAIDGAPMDGPARDDGAAPDATGDARDSGGTDDAGASMDASGDSGGTEDDAGTPGGDSGDTDDDAGAPTDAGGACVVASDCPDDGDVCTSRRCDSGVCSYPPEPDGSSCGAASACCAGICSGLEGAPFCGSCGTVCDANESCIAMVCTCDEPLQDCDALAGCESNRLTDPLNCGTCGMMCVSGACLGGTCAGGGDCVMPGDCMDDGLACTVNTCIANVCGHAAAPGACFIGGTCYTNGQRNPVDACLECDPAMNQSGWSPSTGSCDDGQFCTVADACSGGICTGSPRDCDPPGMACLTGSCDESSDECGVTVTPGFCFIDAQCWPHLTPRPGFPCQHCLDTSPLEWSPRPDGSGCPALGDAGVGMCVSGMCT